MITRRAVGLRSAVPTAPAAPMLLGKRPSPPIGTRPGPPRMPDPESLLAAAFLACAGVVGFAYVGYPIVVWLLARGFGREAVPPPVESADLPTVSLLVVAHDEAADIDARIRNALALRYPPGILEIVIASDGSTDGTN